MRHDRCQDSPQTPSFSEEGERSGGWREFRGLAPISLFGSQISPRNEVEGILLCYSTFLKLKL